jgi:hypothetical protein
MNRRELLKSLAPLAMLPITVNGKEVGKAIQFDPSARYLVFIDPEMINIDSFCEMGTALSMLPVGTPVHAINVPHGKTIDDAIRIYREESHDHECVPQDAGCSFS